MNINFILVRLRTIVVYNYYNTTSKFIIIIIMAINFPKFPRCQIK